MAGYYPSAYDVYDDIYELDDSPPPSPPRRDGGGDRYPDPPKGAYEAPYSKPPMPNSSNGQGSYSRRSPSPVSPPPVAQDQKPQDPIVIDLEQEPAISPPPGAAKPRSRHSPSQDRYRDRSPDWRGSRYRDYGRNESRSSRYRDRSPSDSPPRRYGDRRRSRSDRSPPSRRRSPDYYRRRRSRSRSRSPRRYSPGRRRRYSRSPDRRRRRSSSQSEQEAPKAPEPEPVPAWMQALAQSGMIPQSMVSGGSRPPMLICGYIPGATPTPQFQATTPALVGLPAVSSKKILPQPEPEPEEPEEPAQPEPPSYPLVPMATTLKTGSCKASVRLMRFMLDSYEAPVLPAADPTLITTPQPVNNRRGIIRFEKGMQCPVPGCQPGSTFLTTASFAMHWIALHCESIKQIKCRLCKNNTVAVWGHPLVHLAHVHGISSDYANMNLFMNKTKIYRNHFISPRGFTFDVQNYIEEYNYLQTDNGTYATFEIYCPVFVSFKPGMPCPVTLCPHNLNYTKFEDLVAHWNLVHQEDCYYYVCQHCLKHPLVARYYVTIRAESMQEHMLKEHPYAASEPLVQEMLLNPAYIPPGRHRFLLANQSKSVRACFSVKILLPAVGMPI